MFKKLIKYLSSLRFTIVLIGLLGLIFAIGLWVPQRQLLKAIYLQWQKKSPALVSFLDAFGLTEIYTSPVTVTLWVLFFLNLSLVVWQRIPLVRHRIACDDTKIVDPETAAGYPFRRTYILPSGLDGGACIKLLRKQRFTVLGGPQGFYGVKNRLAPIAFLLFHLSFFLVLLGGLISVYTEFIGYVDLAQNETFRGELNRYNTTPVPTMPKFGSPPSVEFTVKGVVPHVVGNTPTAIDVDLVDREGRTHRVGINSPYDADNSSFVFKDLGIAPLFVMKDPTGKELGGAYFKLNVLKMRHDRFSLGGFDFAAKFYPDFVVIDGKTGTRSQEFNNPVFKLTVTRDGKKVAEGTIPRNGVLEFEGYRLEMRDMPYWVRFYVVKQRGLSILYLGFAIATIGVIWRLLFYKREIVGAVREGDGVNCLVVAGRSEYYKSLAEDEFTKLFDGIAGTSAVER